MAFAIILNQKPSPWFLALQFVLQGLSALFSPHPATARLLSSRSGRAPDSSNGTIAGTSTQQA